MNITLNSLSIGYKNKKDRKVDLINNINFTFSKNGIYGFFGESGIGKSTLFFSILGYYPPLSGTITFNDVNIYNKKYKNEFSCLYDEYISFLPTYQILFKNLTIKENASIFKVSIKELQEELLKFDIADSMNKYPNALSKGQTKIIEILITVLQNREYIFLDEPTSDLDANNTNLILAFLRERKNKHKIIVISHSKEALKNSCDFLYEISNKSLNTIFENKVYDNVPCEKKQTSIILVNKFLLFKSSLSYKNFYLNDFFISLIFFIFLTTVYLGFNVLLGNFDGKLDDISKDLPRNFSLIYFGFAGILLLIMVFLFYYTQKAKNEKKKKLPSLYLLIGLKKKEKLLVTLFEILPTIIFQIILLPLTFFIIKAYIPNLLNKEFYKLTDSFDYVYSSVIMILLFILFLISIYFYTYYRFFIKRNKKIFKEDN